MKKKVIFISLIICIIFLIILSVNNRIKIKEYENNDFSFKYDTTWNIKVSDEIKLIHKKSESTLTFYTKELDDRYIDTGLKDLIKDIVYSIESQNPKYKLINKENNINDDIDSYSFLYELDDEEVLVNIYKQDTKLLICIYEAKIKYYDIVLDSVDSILDSIKIYTGE